MLQDIRSYFQPTRQKKESSNSNPPPSNKNQRKRILIDSDSDEDVPKVTPSNYRTVFSRMCIFTVIVYLHIIIFINRKEKY